MVLMFIVQGLGFVGLDYPNTSVSDAERGSVPPRLPFMREDCEGVRPRAPARKVASATESPAGFRVNDPLSGEVEGEKTAKASLWPWLLGKRPAHL